MRVVQLTAGQVIDGNTYVGQFPHPIWPKLQCVVWRLHDGTWSHDALSPGQDVGEPEPGDLFHLKNNLQKALLGEGTRHP